MAVNSHRYVHMSGSIKEISMATPALPSETIFTKAFKYRLYPTTDQQHYLAKVFGSCRYVYNRLLAEHQDRYAIHKAHPNLFAAPALTLSALSAKLPLWKQDDATLWLAEPPAQVLQQVIPGLLEAYRGFFKQGRGYPRFKSKRDNERSALYPNQSYKIDGGALYLRKCAQPFKVVWHRPLPASKVTQCCIKRTADGRYWAIFTCQYMPEKTAGTGIIGVDMGLSTYATLSTGEKIANPRHLIQSEKRLARLHRRLSRRQKGSKNRNKQRLKVARLHAHVANQRRDHLHTLTTRLVRENQAIGIESLRITGMVKNRRLAKHIGDAGWGLFGQQLRYKVVASQHAVLVVADSLWPSTQRCSSCGDRPDVKLTLKDRRWVCPHCQTEHDRDVNAAINLKQLAEYRVALKDVRGETAHLYLNSKL